MARKDAAKLRRQAPLAKGKIACIAKTPLAARSFPSEFMRVQ